MKVWSDFSTIVKLALVCLVVGFVVGYCSSVTSGAAERWPGPMPPTSPIHSPSVPARH